MKYYAVRKGVNTGIFTSWDECKINVSNYSGAEYKSFTSESDALNYLNVTEDTNSSTFKYPFAFVDGSYDKTSDRYSYGGILVLDKDQNFTFKKAFEKDSYSIHKNVSGEIFGAMYVIQYCINHNIKSLDLYYDYIGIKNWYSFIWSANKPISIQYQNFSKMTHSKIKVNFIKVKAHTGNYYNELVDELAKQALGLKK